ncbi:MAG: class I SAM-dependent methyltransferase [Rhodothermaceae bacterium]|nr:class I SAM-dependent methyltransferase [Rhodothermaceae bacterium]
MNDSENTSGYARYLEAKRTVDERALNLYVWQRFIDHLNAIENTRSLHILEIGAGTGSTFFNVLDNVTHPSIIYRVVDLEETHIGALRHKLKSWAQNRGGNVVEYADRVVVNLSGKSIDVRVNVDDVLRYLESKTESLRYDAIIGQAILDLFDIDYLLTLLEDVLRQGGLYYFSINFDGVTTFLPEYNGDIDRLVENIYHASMKEEKRDGSQSGRRVLMELMRRGADIIQAGSSDWVVCPSKEGGYVGDEEYFLMEILKFVKKELLASQEIERKVVENWFSHRKQQISNSGLVFIAHQLDVLASKE